MLEIILLYVMGKKIAAIAAGKGRGGTGYVFLLLGLWFGGEIGGGIFGFMVALAADPGREPNLGVVYLCAIMGAAVGAVTAFVIVNSLSPVRPHHDDMYDDRDDRDDLDIRLRR
jgi:hypothetical protein